MQIDLSGAVALVTGAAGNIGQAVTAALREQGCTVVESDISKRGGDAMRPHDVTSESDWDAVIAYLKSTYGRLDILVNNAGVAPMGRISDMPLSEWRRCHTINVEGTLLGLRAANDLMAKSGVSRSGGASVVNVSSAAADRGTAFSAAYCTSKAAATMLTRCAALEFSSLGQPIRVNAVHPGAVDSDLFDGILAEYSKLHGGTPLPELRAATIRMIPLGRMVSPDEVADVVVFLASNASRFVHGTSVNVDGGYAA